MAEAGGAPGDVIALRGRPGGDDVRGLADERVRARARRRDRRSTSPSPPTSRASSSGRSPSTRSAPGPVIARGTTLHPLVVRAAVRDRRAGGDPVHGRVAGPRDGHRRRRGPHQPRRRADRARLGAAALHALAGRAGLAGRHRRRGEADRGVRAAPRAGHVVRALSGAAAAAVRHRRDAAARAPPTRTRGAARGAARGPRRSTPRALTAADLAGRPDRRRDRARAAARRGRLGAADRRARRRRARGSAAARTPSCAPPTCRTRCCPGSRSCSSWLRGARRRHAGAGDRQLRAGRAAEADARRDRPLLPVRPGRRSAPTPRTAPRCRRSPAGAPGTLGHPAPARADDRDRRHAARHRLRPRRRRALLRGRDRAVRGRPSSASADAVAADAGELRALLEAALGERRAASGVGNCARIIRSQTRSGVTGAGRSADARSA